MTTKTDKNEIAVYLFNDINAYINEENTQRLAIALLLLTVNNSEEELKKIIALYDVLTAA